MNILSRISNLSKIALRKLYRDKEKVFTIKSVLNKNFPEGTVFRFILVGANDGVSHDFLFDYLKKRDCLGIAFEPVADSFEKLLSNFDIFTRVKLVKKAVHPSKNEVTIYKVIPEKLKDLPDWASGIASLDPEHYKKSGISSSLITGEISSAGPLMKMLEEYVPELLPDYLQTDTEGFDAEVIKQIDFTKIRPLIIRFEYINLDPISKRESIQLLKKNGYYCFYDGMDIGAVQLRKIKL
ncbi:MAG: FkbM family methyltransferase [Chitinophagaceae bacterium]|nr:FkbM family methyltransferase [Saprospiraceae bacterium]MBK9380300.1 FkbM family methyltransferase [Chitinophagaceae bacterium]